MAWGGGWTPALCLLAGTAAVMSQEVVATGEPAWAGSNDTAVGSNTTNASAGNTSAGAAQDTREVDAFKNARFGFGDVIEWAPEGSLQAMYNDHIRFELTSDNVHTLEVVLYVANHWENYLELTVRSSSDRDDTPDPHIISDATCYHLFDECTQQRLQYTRPSLIPHGSPYSNRLAVRVEAEASLFGSRSLKGKWTIKISNNLPKDVDTAFVHLEVRQREYTTVSWFLCVVVLVLVLLCGALMLTDYISGRLHTARGIIRYVDDDVDDVAPRTIRESVTSFRTRAADRMRSAMRYSRMAPDPPADTNASNAAPQQEGDAEMVDIDGAVGDDAVVCRICKTADPLADLFAPCACTGPLKYVHRACLAELREKATTEENKRRCPECRKDYPAAVPVQNPTLAAAKQAVRTVATCVACTVCAWLPFVAVGYIFKAVVGCLYGELHQIVWRIDLYHHLVAMAVMISVAVRVGHFGPSLEKLLPHSPWLRYAILGVSLLLDIPAGYLGNFLLWCVADFVWDWQVHYCKGALITLLYVNCIHEQFRVGHNTWHMQHRMDRVIEDPNGPHARAKTEEASETAASPPASTSSSPSPSAAASSAVQPTEEV